MCRKQWKHPIDEVEEAIMSGISSESPTDAESHFGDHVAAMLHKFPERQRALALVS